METNVAIAWSAGIIVGALIGGFFGFAYGLQAGKNKSGSITPSFYLSRDDVLSLIAHRIQQIVRTVRERLPASRQHLRPAFSDDQLVHRSEYSSEYIRLYGWFHALRSTEVADVVSRVTTANKSIPVDESA